MRYIYVHGLLTIFLSIIAASEKEVRCFSPEQHEDAYYFVLDMLIFARENAYDKMIDYKVRRMPVFERKWKRAYKSITMHEYNRVGVWTKEDENHALKLHDKVVKTDIWNSYLAYPSKVEYFEPVYMYLQHHNFQKLQEVLKKKLIPRARSIDETKICNYGISFDRMMLLSIFLLDQEYKNINYTVSQSHPQSLQ